VTIDDDNADYETAVQTFVNMGDPFRDVLRDDNGNVVAEHFMPLRVLPCEAEGHKFDGIMDEGSSVIVMSKRVWESLGSPMDGTKTFQMQTANGTSSQTEGVLLNIPVKIAGITFYLQVQVVDKAPFDFLLGKPFYALSRSVVTTEPDGRTTVTLRDPNSDAEITVPTRERRFKKAFLLDYCGQTKGF
jgi:hypothetical protein